MLILLLLISLSTQTSLPPYDELNFNVRCIWFSSYEIYDFSRFTHQYSYLLTDGSQIDYSLCGNVSQICAESPARFVLRRQDGTCDNLSAGLETNAAFFKYTFLRYYDQIQVSFKQNEKSENSAKVVVFIDCSEDDSRDAKEFNFDSSEYLPDQNTYVLKGKSQTACLQKGITQFMGAQASFKYVLGPVLLIIGFLISYMPLRMVKLVMALVTGFVFLLVVDGVTEEILENTHSQFNPVLLITAAFFIGLLVGVFLVRREKMLVYTAGVFFGIVFSLVINLFVTIVIFSSKIFFFTNLVFWIFIGLLIAKKAPTYVVPLVILIEGYYLKAYAMTYMFGMPLIIITYLARNEETQQIVDHIGVLFFCIQGVLFLILNVSLFRKFREIRGEVKKERELVAKEEEVESKQ